VKRRNIYWYKSKLFILFYYYIIILLRPDFQISRINNSILIGLRINLTAHSKQDAFPSLDAIVRTCVTSQPWQIPRLLYICSIASCHACDVPCNISLSLKELCADFKLTWHKLSMCNIVADFMCQNRKQNEDILYIYYINLKSFYCQQIIAELINLSLKKDFKLM